MPQFYEEDLINPGAKQPVAFAPQAKPEDVRPMTPAELAKIKAALGGKSVSSPGAASMLSAPPAAAAQKPQSGEPSWSKPIELAKPNLEPAAPPVQPLAMNIDQGQFAKTAAAQQALAAKAAPELTDKNYLRKPGKDEGMKSTSRLEGKVGATSSNVGAISDDAYNEAFQRVEEGTPAMRRQKSDIDRLRAVIGKLAGDQEDTLQTLDLSPGMALTDTWYGGNIQKGYTPPTKKRALIAQLNDQLLKAEGSMSQDEINLLKAQLQDKFGQSILQGGAVTRQFTQGTGGKQPNPYEALRYQESVDQHRREQGNKDQEAVKKLIDNRGDEFRTIADTFSNIDETLKRAEEKGEQNPGYFKVPDMVAGVIGSKEVQIPFDILKSEEGKDIGRYTDTLKTALIRKYSGTAASDKEVRRLASLLGDQLTQGPQQFRKALRDLQSAVRNAEADREKGLSQSQRKIYEESGALRSDDLKSRFGMPDGPEIQSPAAAESKGGETLEQKKARLKKQLGG